MAASIGSWIFLKIDFSEFVLKLHKAFSGVVKSMPRQEVVISS